MAAPHFLTISSKIMFHSMSVPDKMSQPVIGTLMLYLSASLCSCLLFILIKLFHKLWWSPRSIQNLMASQGIKGPPYRFLHGNTKQMISSSLEAMATPMELSHHVFPKVTPYMYSCTKLYGTIYLDWIGPQPELVVSDPELAKVILNNRDGAYGKDEVTGNLKKLLGDGLVTSQGEKWLKQRKLANHAFHGENLKGMIPDMIAGVEMMLQRWRSYVGKEMDMFGEFKLLASEVISRTAFGNSYLEGENIFDMLTKLIQIASTTSLKIKIPLIGNFVKTSDDIEAERLEQGMRDSILKLIRTREERVKTGQAESFGDDFLGSLLSAYHSDDKTKKISLDDVVDECKTFYMTGHETTLTSLSWVTLLLAIHTEWQDKARKEVLELFGQENPNPRGIARLTTMGMIINESLRLYPPVNNIRREVGKEVSLGDVVIPVNTRINIPILALHHDPKIWGEDFHLFKPERFAQGVAKATNNNSAAFMPFGLGPRTCVGLHFAANQIKIALSMILQRYEFTLSPNYLHSPVQVLMVRPQHGVQIILHKL